MKELKTEGNNNPFTSPLEQEAKEYPMGLYDKFPAYEISGKINKGYEELAERVINRIDKGLRVLVVDGYHGVNWNTFADNFKKEFAKTEIDIEFYQIDSCLKDSSAIDKEIEPFMGDDDRIFGKHYPMGPEVFYDAVKIAEMRIEASIKRGDKSGKLMVVYGTGAGLIELWDELWYIDIPKDLLQDYAREEKLKNLGDSKTVNFETFYKRSYFIEWPALNRLKKRLINDIDIFIDFIDSENPSYMDGYSFRNELESLSETPFRVRPWFFPGPWGGQFMKGHMDLDKSQPNFAWSFELIVPENGIILKDQNNRLECSFDCVMFLNNKNILGKAAKQFKYEWPIRFDYLDTIDGGNLSTQVHPRPNYIKREFGETYTQDETYYIVNSKPNSNVYLGLKDDCDLDEFKSVLVNSVNEEKEVEIDKYVNSEPSKPHDLFLIPNGTVHCSGSGNLVLEISATPYIFTFKIYDYLRRDLEGKLRPINLERGFENIREERKEDFVAKNLVARPNLVDSGKDWQLFELYNKPFTFYNIYRVEFENEYILDTKSKAYAVNLVEGEKVELTGDNGKATDLAYIETMLIPAATGKVKIVNKGKSKCKMVLVHIREDIGITEPVNNPNE